MERNVAHPTVHPMITLGVRLRLPYRNHEEQSEGCILRSTVVEMHNYAYVGEGGRDPKPR